MRRNIDKIEIKEPPIQELTQKRSCLKRTCFTGCGCIIVFLGAAILLLKFTTGPKIKEIKDLPENFPTNIPIYDGDNIQKITFTSGKEKGRGIEIAAFIPKLILSPIMLNMSEKSDDSKITKEGGDVKIKEESYWQDFINLMKEPVVDHRDNIMIEWTDMPAEPWFVQSYYETELKKFDYITEQNNKEDNSIRELSFELDKIDGILYVEDDPNEGGTDYVSLTIKIPITKN